MTVKSHLDAGSQDQFALIWESKQWTFQMLPQNYLHRPTLCHGLVAQDHATWVKSHSVCCCFLIDDITVRSDGLADLKATVRSLKDFVDLRIGHE